MTPFELDRSNAERHQATRRVMRRHAVNEWWPRELHAHPKPDPTLPPDDVRRDLTIVAGAAAILVVIAAVAQALNPLVPA
jgi:hypothetical protein